MVLIYLQEAFDFVDHDILLGKLKSNGVHKSFVFWFESYLTYVVPFLNPEWSHKGIHSGPITISNFY